MERTILLKYLKNLTENKSENGFVSNTIIYIFSDLYSIKFYKYISYKFK